MIKRALSGFSGYFTSTLELRASFPHPVARLRRMFSFDVVKGTPAIGSTEVHEQMYVDETR